MREERPDGIFDSSDAHHRRRRDSLGVCLHLSEQEARVFHVKTVGKGDVNQIFVLELLRNGSGARVAALPISFSIYRSVVAQPK